MLAVANGRDAAGITRRLLDDWFGSTELSNVGFRMWDGGTWPDGESRPSMVVLRHPGSMREMFISGTELGLAEAFLKDDFDVEGDMETAFEIYEVLNRLGIGWGGRLKAMGMLRRLPCVPGSKNCESRRAKLRGFRHSAARDAQAIKHHYDVSNEFYSLWLDRRMVYSCAYFNDESEELEVAQERKLDYVCRKLRLKPGQRILDIGCGWGGLVMHAARCYGVDATGITVSRAQAELASRRIDEAGLGKSCRVKVMDYREVDESRPFDALVSIGMFEHVGASVLPAYFDKAHRLLRDGGVFLNHGIASRATDAPAKGPGFIDIYVFPDGDLVPINHTLDAAESAGFEVRDVESLREHYTLTLRHWVKRLEGREDEAVRLTDEKTYRIWRLYMSGSAYWFKTGRNNVYQTLLVKTRPCGDSCLPLTRADWY
jgi:cyclopropane-fatty-acyl-phospholipid synthase